MRSRFVQRVIQRHKARQQDAPAAPPPPPVVTPSGPSDIRYFFDPGAAYHVIRHWCGRGRESIRIAVAYFTVRGYALIRDTIVGKRVLIMVGFDDQTTNEVRTAVIDEIMRDLRNGIDTERRVMVRELVERLERGEIGIVDVRGAPHHGKVYIVDDLVAIVTSANLSYRGLRQTIEAGYTVRSGEGVLTPDVHHDPDSVRGFLTRYDGHFHATYAVHITQQLIEALKRWLQLASPFDIYLKTMLALAPLEELKLQRESYKQPRPYQHAVIAVALRQLREHRGALVVASTGLGKTVIAIDIARRLHEAGEVVNVLVIGPKAVRREWSLGLQRAALPSSYFLHQTLDVTNAKAYPEVGDLIQQLAELDSSWLVIVDESHELRNYQRYDAKKRRWVRRTVFSRLLPAIDRSGCKVLLLTGTPYAKDVEDINTQLLLLPHTASHRERIVTHAEFPRAWQVREVDDLRDFPVASVITTPAVAKQFGTVDEEGSIYIAVGDRRQYIPRVRLYRADVPLALEEIIAPVLNSHILRVASASGLQEAIIEFHALVAWTSSPWALREVLERTLATPDWDTPKKQRGQEAAFNVAFQHNLVERQVALLPVLEQLRALQFSDDRQLVALVTLLQQRVGSGKKVIVFCTRHATVAYLEAALRELAPDLRAASMVRWNNRPQAPGEFQLKTDAQLNELLTGFAPEANRDRGVSEDRYDVFLATDAFSAGVNMQDAHVVVHYDLPWTVVETGQRAGRVLRFSPEARSVELHVFVPQMEMGNSRLGKARLVQRFWNRLIERDQLARRLLDLPSLPAEAHQEDIDMLSLGGVRELFLGEVEANAVQSDGLPEQSPIYDHLAVLEQHRARARRLDDDLTSALSYRGSEPLVFLLLRHQGRVVPLLYNPKTRRTLRQRSAAQLLGLLRCGPGSEAAIIDPDEIERSAVEGLRRWCRQHHIDPVDVDRICTLYLQPEQQPTQSMLSPVHRHVQHN